MSAHATTSVENGKFPATLELGLVELTVLDIDRSVAFYQDVIGLRLNSRDDNRVAMGAGGRDLVVLVEEQAAKRAGRHAGLYHFALLFESREDLANVALRIAHSSSPIDGASDHGTHEAIYLPDPDGNGIELAWDRPRDEWPSGDPAKLFAHGPAPLDTHDLLSLVPDQRPRRFAGDDLKMGHLHLHVGDLDESIAFYVDALGFDLQTTYAGTAAFVSAGGYHHHLAFNLWRGRNADRAPDPATVAGLRHWTIQLQSADELDAVRKRLQDAGYKYEDGGTSLLAADPVGIPVLVELASS
jgi:catechol 2,3-dioxygenase